MNLNQNKRCSHCDAKVDPRRIDCFACGVRYDQKIKSHLIVMKYPLSPDGILKMQKAAGEFAAADYELLTVVVVEKQYHCFFRLTKPQVVKTYSSFTDDL